MSRLSDAKRGIDAQAAGLLTSVGSNVWVELHNETNPNNNTAQTITTTVTSRQANKARFDYDGDNKTDVSLYRPSNGLWYLLRSQDGETVIQLGNATDKIAPADYDGDGQTDVAVYRPETGAWYVFNSSTSVVSVTSFGVAEDLPTPGDYDGDNKADIAIYRPSTGTWAQPFDCRRHRYTVRLDGRHPCTGRL